MVTKTLFCISPYQVWDYHTECDIEIIKSIASGFKPDKLLIITCDGNLTHCDLRENIVLAAGCSEKDACKACCKSKGNYLKRIEAVAIDEGILFENVDLDVIKNKEIVPVKKREYYMSEVCSYYRLDELNIEKTQNQTRWQSNSRNKDNHFTTSLKIIDTRIQLV